MCLGWRGGVGVGGEPAGGADGGRDGAGLPGVVGRERRRATTPSTASSWATTGSSGARKASTRRTPGCSAPWPAGACWRSGAVPPSARAGWSGRAPTWSGSTSRSGSCGSAATWTAAAAQACGPSRPTRRRCHSPTQTFDLACSAFGGLPFVRDAGPALREVHRVLRPGGRLVFSVTHPVRWAMPDDPGERGAADHRLVLRPHAVRRGGRRRRTRVRRAPPHAR